MFQNEIDEIINYFLLNGIYDRSIYKYDKFSHLLRKLYINKNDYQIRKIILYLIKENYIFQIRKNKSYVYQLNNKNDLKPTPKKEPDLLTPEVVIFN